MDENSIKSAIESILFASGEPVNAQRLCEALDVTPEQVKAAVAGLCAEYSGQNHGIEVIAMDDAYQMVTKKQNGDFVRKVMDMRRATALSQAALEVLAVIAYNQPVTKAYVEQIRGVDCSGVIGSLTAKNLVEEKGRLDLPGRPLLYGTTDNFLRCFSISDLTQLPPLPESESTEEDEEAADSEAEQLEIEMI
jgi:segregation and condensation protein B